MRLLKFREFVVSGFSIILAVAGIFADVSIDDFEDGYNGNDIGTPWYFFNDSSNGGDSKIDNAGPGNTFKGNYGPGNGSTYAGVMQFTLGLGFPEPYVGMGFLFSNDKTADGKVADVNMTGATAIQFDIKGTEVMYVRVEIIQSTILDYNYYYKDVLVNESWNTVTIDLSSEEMGGDLAQQEWGDYEEFDITKLSGINWVYQDYDAVEGKVSIDNVVILGDPLGLKTPPPYPPILSVPAWKAVVDTATTINWHPSVGATGYKFQIAASEIFDDPLIDASNLTDTFLMLTGLEKAQTYYWRVSAYSGADTGRWSSTGMFSTSFGIPSVPVLLTPEDSEIAVPVSATLTWAEVPGATSYNLQVSTSSTFASNIIEKTDIATISFKTATLVNETKYFWRVSATNSSGTSDWSTVYCFTTIKPTPAIPVLLIPANAAIDVDTVGTFIWNTSSGADKYRLQVSKTSSFDICIADKDVSDTSYTNVSLNTNTKYYWRVLALTSDGNFSISEIRNFSTKMEIPQIPLLIIPANGAINVPLTTTVSWGEVAGAESYDLDLSTSSDFPTAITDSKTITTTSTSISGLFNSTVYYVRVRASNVAGKSEWSALRSFTTVDPQPSTARLPLLGFYTKGSKRIIVKDAPDSLFEIKDSLGNVLLTGKLGAPSLYQPSGETVRIADISSVIRNGSAALFCKGKKAIGGDFTILPNPLRTMAGASIKAFYYQRASTALTSDYAGKWARVAGHPDTAVNIHSSVGITGKISSPKGWYDAGDYGKYIVNSGITVYTLLALYEHFPVFMAGMGLNIPESNNIVPDILDEVRWNLEWILSMQTADGGVYSKLTPLTFDAIVMPDKSKPARYVFMKTTGAALDFAAVMAMSSRLYSAYDAAFASKCLEAAVKAYAWATSNKTVRFVQPAGCNTGEYGDSDFSDEFFWASAELALATKNNQYALHTANPLPYANVPSWQSVSTLGLYTIVTNMHAFPKTLVDSAKSHIVATANNLLARQKTGYGISMANEDFVWGSNHVAASQGILLLYAHYLTGEDGYLTGAQQQIDYLLGRNPFSSSFVTGFGTPSPLRPHHRLSQADSVVPPIPGFLVGGSNPNLEDKIECGNYGGKPATSWLDHDCSYASNEIAINWNASFAYFCGALEAIYSGEKVNGFNPTKTTVKGIGILPGNCRITLCTQGNNIVFKCPKPIGGAQQGIFRMYNASGKLLVQVNAADVSIQGVNYYSVNVPSSRIAAGYLIVSIDAGVKRFQRSFILQ